MVQSDLTPFVTRENARDAGQSAEQAARAFPIIGAVDVHVRDLMVADREGTAAKRVEGFTKRAGSHAQQPCLSEHAIERDRPANIAVAIFADDPYPGPGLTRSLEDDGARIV